MRRRPPALALLRKVCISLLHDASQLTSHARAKGALAWRAVELTPCKNAEAAQTMPAEPLTTRHTRHRLRTPGTTRTTTISWMIGALLTVACGDGERQASRTSVNGGHAGEPSTVVGSFSGATNRGGAPGGAPPSTNIGGFYPGSAGSRFGGSAGNASFAGAAIGSAGMGGVSTSASASGGATSGGVATAGSSFGHGGSLIASTAGTSTGGVSTGGVSTGGVLTGGSSFGGVSSPAGAAGRNFAGNSSGDAGAAGDANQSGVAGAPVSYGGVPNAMAPLSDGVAQPRRRGRCS